MSIGPPCFVAQRVAAAGKKKLSLSLSLIFCKPKRDNAKAKAEHSLSPLLDKCQQQSKYVNKWRKGGGEWGKKKISWECLRCVPLQVAILLFLCRHIASCRGASILFFPLLPHRESRLPFSFSLPLSLSLIIA